MNPERLKQIQILLMEASNEADISTAQALAELVRAFLLSDTDAPGHVYGLEFVGLLDRLLLDAYAVNTEAAP